MPYNRERAKKRWSVELMKVYRQFCGWSTLQKLVDAVEVGLKGPKGEVLIHDERERDEARAMIATVFETGARICEVIGQGEHFPGLKCKDIIVLEDRVNVIFNIEKRYRKKVEVTKYKATDGTFMRWDNEEEAKESGHPYIAYRGYITERVIEIRNIVFPKAEPLAPTMIAWAEKVKMEKGEDAKLFNIKYSRAYRIVKAAGEKIGLDFPPHRLRAERATQILQEYGFTDHELTEWFAWESPAIAHKYTTMMPKIIDKMFKIRHDALS